MKSVKLILVLLISLSFSEIFSQCAEGEVEVTIEVGTDQYGYETYWELVPSGNDCGEGTIFSGGNNSVGCDGGGDQTAGPGSGYGSNSTIDEGPFCVEPGNYDIVFVDDWGDGGPTFTVIISGIVTEEFAGTGSGATFTFTAAEPFDYDLSLEGINLAGFSEAADQDLVASVRNFGSEIITSFDFNYSIDGAPSEMSTITGVSISPGETIQVTHEALLALSDASGIIELAVEVLNPNGETDEDLTNNSLDSDLNIIEPIPNLTVDYLNDIYDIEELAGTSEGLNYPTDLDWHPNRPNNELWVLNRHVDDLGGSTVTISNAGESNQSEIWKQDGNAWHFMSYPTGLAFSNNTNFATSHGVFDANHSASEPNGPAFTGPSLWSSDLSIYAEPSGGNGSHLDMLHESPRAQGIASEGENVFWLIDGHSSDIVRYDFVEDHGPGNDFHGDAIVRRYPLDEMTKDPNNQVVSHLVIDDEKKWLYAVDYGNQRVIRLDITTGSVSNQQPSFGQTETLAEYSVCTGYVSEEIISDLSEPSGIEIIEDNLYVSDYATGVINIYDVSETPVQFLGTLETGFSSLQGIKFAPDGQLWGVDMLSNTLFRVLQGAVSVNENIVDEEKSIFYPNPVDDSIYLSSDIEGLVNIFDAQGKLILAKQNVQSNRQIDLSSLKAGMYSVVVNSDSGIRSQRLIKK